VVFVHGGGPGGALAWQAQAPLEARWRLVMPARPGYGKSPPAAREDFEAEAELIAELLEERSHLVGHSYGGVVALFAAVLRPEAVASLTLIEPGASSVARGVPAVDAFEAGLRRALQDIPPSEPERRIRAVFSILDPLTTLPEPLPPSVLRFAERLPVFRWPMEADIPIEKLAAAAYPKLVVTGGRHPAFEAIADALRDQIRARRVVIPGGHATQNVGAPFNAEVERLWLSA
jgi:pimeloyl-ACP methyl ester carboxylesterase